MEEFRTRLGDRSRRVTRTCNTLQLGTSDTNGRLRLYHKGHTLVHHDRHLQKLKDDELIVVTWDYVRIRSGLVLQKPQATPFFWLGRQRCTSDFRTGRLPQEGEVAAQDGTRGLLNLRHPLALA